MAMTPRDACDASLVYGTRRFNLVTGRQACATHEARDAHGYLDPLTGRLRDDLGQARACPICRDHQAVTLFVKEGFPHVRCVRCRMVYTNPILTASAHARYITDDAEWTKVLVAPEQVAMDRAKFAFGLDRLGPPGTLVDVGCGPGTFLRVAGDAGWGVTGIEPNAASAAVARDHATISEQPLERTDLPAGTFDAVTLWEVLEHVPDPRDFLTRCHGLLKPGGRLLVCVPNIDALVTRMLHEHSGTFYGPSHLNFFNIETLTRIVTERGCRVRARESLITELGTIQNYLDYEEPYVGAARTAWEWLTPEYLHAHFLGSRILVVATA